MAKAAMVKLTRRIRDRG